MTARFILISGCSGGGKSSLLAELARRGQAVVTEPGRRIVAEALASDLQTLPWVDPTAFARRAVAMALADRDFAGRYDGPVFFDRGLIDAAAALEYATGEPMIDQLASAHRYHHRVFMAPPWPEIWQTDVERRHSFDSAVAEYERLVDAYTQLDYELVLLPKASIERRADFILRSRGKTPG